MATFARRFGRRRLIKLKKPSLSEAVLLSQSICTQAGIEPAHPKILDLPGGTLALVEQAGFKSGASIIPIATADQKLNR
jgi:hypothetical protein